MHIDIIIPTLNEAHRLPYLLDFLCEHKENDKLHIIVVDANQSNDFTEAICLDYDISYLKSSATCRSIQMNEGAKLARSQMLMFLHADVMPPQDFYDAIEETIKAGSEAGFFSYKFDSQKTILRLNAYFTKYNNLFTGGGDQCLFIKRDRFNKLGGFDQHYSIMEDFEFFERMKKHEVQYQIIKSPALVSARKYDEHSYLKVNLTNLITFARYKMGGNPADLKKTYRDWLN